MRVQAAGETYDGRAVDLRGLDLDPATVVAAVRGETDGDAGIRVDGPSPGAVHRHVGVIRRGMVLEPRPAMAAAARSLGRTAPQDDAVDAVTAELASIDPPTADTEAARRRLAEAGDERERLRERVARLQGRVRALRESGQATDDAEAALADAVRTLSEVETEAVAARQALSAVREDARAARDARERRLRLEDRLGNLQRAARAHLADAVREDVAAAVRDAPGDASALDDASPVTVAVAIGRVAAVAAPVVLVDSPFDDVAAAAGWLDAPALQV